MLIALLTLCVRLSPDTPLWIVAPLLFLFSLVSFHSFAKRVSTLWHWCLAILSVGAWRPQSLVLLLPLVVLCRMHFPSRVWVERCNWLALATLLALAAAPHARADDRAADDLPSLVLALFAAAVSSPASAQHLLGCGLVLVLRGLDLPPPDVWLLLPALATEIPPLLHSSQRQPIQALHVVVSAVTLGACAAAWQPLLLAMLGLQAFFFLLPPRSP